MAKRTVAAVHTPDPVEGNPAGDTVAADRTAAGHSSVVVVERRGNPWTSLEVGSHPGCTGWGLEGILVGEDIGPGIVGRRAGFDRIGIGCYRRDRTL